MIRAPQTPSSLAIAKVNKLTLAVVTEPATELAMVATTPIPRCLINKWPVTIPMLRVSGTVEGETSDQIAIYTIFYSSQNTAQKLLC